MKIAPEIQGNIVKSHGRDHTAHIFFQFNAGQKEAAKSFINELANLKFTSVLKQKYARIYNAKNSITPTQPFGGFVTRKGGAYVLRLHCVFSNRWFSVPKGDSPFNRFGLN